MLYLLTDNLTNMVIMCCFRYDYELVFGTSLLHQSKADRLLYGESLMTHAMVLTAVSDEVMTTACMYSYF